jgi:uncharacterized glyoxalase superfamily protein PhnB
MQSLTPNLIVEDIEACLPFWIDRAGFEKTVEVPEGDRLGFVILKHGACELMLQSRASLAKDIPAATGPFSAFLYLRLADLDAIRRALAGWPPLAPERTTFYGAREIIVKDPAGNVVVFSQHQD